MAYTSEDWRRIVVAYEKAEERRKRQFFDLSREVAGLSRAVGISDPQHLPNHLDDIPDHLLRQLRSIRARLGR